eukprot:Gb_39098 [translate_table: standard]
MDSDNRRSSGGPQDDSKGRNMERYCDMNEDEVDLIVRLHKLLGDRWALIAGRIPGRTPDEIEKYWKLRKAKAQSN